MVALLGCALLLLLLVLVGCGCVGGDTEVDAVGVGAGPGTPEFEPPRGGDMGGTGTCCPSAVLEGVRVYTEGGFEGGVIDKAADTSFWS